MPIAAADRSSCKTQQQDAGVCLPEDIKKLLVPSSYASDYARKYKIPYKEMENLSWTPTANGHHLQKQALPKNAMNEHLV